MVIVAVVELARQKKMCLPMIDEARMRPKRAGGNSEPVGLLRYELQVDLIQKMRLVQNEKTKCPVRRGRNRTGETRLSAGIVGSNMSCRSSSREYLERGVSVKIIVLKRETPQYFFLTN